MWFLRKMVSACLSEGEQLAGVGNKVKKRMEEHGEELVSKVDLDLLAGGRLGREQVLEKGVEWLHGSKSSLWLCKNAPYSLSEQVFCEGQKG
jgi:hypothetical protein